MLKWKSAHTQVEVCTYSTGSVHMLNWKCARTQLRECTCSPRGVNMLNWKCAYVQLEVCTCITETVHMLTLKHAYSSVSMPMLKCKRAQVVLRNNSGVYSVPVPANYPSHFKLPAGSRNTSFSTEQWEILWKYWYAHTSTFDAQPKYALKDAKKKYNLFIAVRRNNILFWCILTGKCVCKAAVNDIDTCMEQWKWWIRNTRVSVSAEEFPWNVFGLFHTRHLFVPARLPRVYL